MCVQCALCDVCSTHHQHHACSTDYCTHNTHAFACNMHITHIIFLRLLFLIAHYCNKFSQNKQITPMFVANVFICCYFHLTPVFVALGSSNK